MIFVPDLENYKCVVIRDSDILRAYEEIPQPNTDINYTDYYYNSNYYFYSGIQSFNNYTTIPNCLDSSLLTSDFYYRNDIDKILNIFLVLFIFCIFIPFFVLMKLFKKGKI